MYAQIANCFPRLITTQRQ